MFVLAFLSLFLSLSLSGEDLRMACIIRQKERERNASPSFPLSLSLLSPPSNRCFQERRAQREKTAEQFGLKSYFISHAVHLLLTYSADHLSTLASEVFVDNVLKKNVFLKDFFFFAIKSTGDRTVYISIGDRERREHIFANDDDVDDDDVNQQFNRITTTGHTNLLFIDISSFLAMISLVEEVQNSFGRNQIFSYTRRWRRKGTDLSWLAAVNRSISEHICVISLFFFFSNEFYLLR